MLIETISLYERRKGRKVGTNDRDLIRFSTRGCEKY